MSFDPPIASGALNGGWSEFPLHGQTTDNAQHALFSFTVPQNEGIILEITAIGNRVGTSDCCHTKAVRATNRGTGNINSPSEIYSNNTTNGTANADINFNTGTQIVTINVQGNTGQTWNWDVWVRLCRVK